MKNIKYCAFCNKTFTDLSISFCPFDATPLDVMTEPTTAPTDDQELGEPSPRHFIPESPTQKVSNLLGFGIFLMPYIFAWFTLKKGYSDLARIVSFSWLALVILPQFFIHSNSSQSVLSSYDESKVSRNSSGFVSSNNTATPTPTINLSPKSAALAQAKIDFKWKKDGFGTVMTADFTIYNPSIYAIKDIEVTCTHYASSGTQIDSNTRTIYEIVPAKDKKFIKDFNMGFIHAQASSSTCKIEDLVAVR